MANILIKQGREIAGSNLVTPSSKANKTDLTSIMQTGTTSSQAISAGTYFYLNDVLVRAKADTETAATYEVVTAGALNELNDAIKGLKLAEQSFSTVGSFVAISNATISNLSKYKSIEIKCYNSANAMATLFLDVTNGMFTQVFVVPQLVDGGVTYRYLIEVKFENNQLYVRFNILGYTFTPTKVEVYAHMFA